MISETIKLPRVRFKVGLSNSGFACPEVNSLIWSDLVPLIGQIGVGCLVSLAVLVLFYIPFSKMLPLSTKCCDQRGN